MSSDEPSRVERIASEPVATRYDLVLAAIPLALLAGALVGLVTDVGPRPRISAGGVVALCAFCDAVFGDPPIEQDGQRTS